MARAIWILLSLVILAAMPGCGKPSSAATTSEGPAALRTLIEGSLGPVSATVKTRDGEVRFGDRIPLLLEVTAQPGAEVQDVVVSSRLGHFRVRGRKAAERSGSLTRYSFTVEPERTGTNIGSFPPIPFTVKEGEGQGEQRALDLAPFEIEVLGLAESEKPSLSSIKDPLPPVEIPSPPAGRWGFWIALGGVVTFVALALAWRWIAKHRQVKGPPPIDPVDEARRELERLLASDLLKLGRFGDFYVVLTGIVRRFVERTTGVHAPKQTTEEFLREMEGRKIFAPERQRAFGDFLMAADLVKFAAQIPKEAEVQGAVEAARVFCGLTLAAREMVRA